ncbi:hypothetical protein NT6N_19290 [Oceaniferula spumae]|uniref:Ice-binding protein C-terminal domain-containing protein n=1 Tax=Oceaniferula spumae TaxID=2979115 RepID=A0AAT9FLS9_9BACT
MKIKLPLLTLAATIVVAQPALAVVIASSDFSGSVGATGSNGTVIDTDGDTFNDMTTGRNNPGSGNNTGVSNLFGTNAYAALFMQSDNTSGNTISEFNAYSLQAIPEPSTTALLGLGGLALILRRRW